MRSDRKLAATPWLAIVLAACAAPTLCVTAEPADAELFVDSKFRGLGDLDTRLPYYGTIRATLAPSILDESDRRDGRASLEVDEPVTPWLFPLDFVLELAGLTLGWIDDSEHHLEIRAGDREDVIVSGRFPPGIEALRLRAGAMAVQR